MPDFLVFGGLALLTFILGLGWFLAVSRDFLRARWKPILTVWGTACAALFVFLTAVGYLHLVSFFFGWIKPVR